MTALVCPSHSIGSTAYLLESDAGRDLFPGDIVFFGGSIGLLNCYGSDLAAYRANFPRLAALEIGGFYPSHFTFAVANGRRHLLAARDALDGLDVPRTF